MIPAPIARLSPDWAERLFSNESLHPPHIGGNIYVYGAGRDGTGAILQTHAWPGRTGPGKTHQIRHQVRPTPTSAQGCWHTKCIAASPILDVQLLFIPCTLPCMNLTIVVPVGVPIIILWVSIGIPKDASVGIPVGYLYLVQLHL